MRFIFSMLPVAACLVAWTAHAQVQTVKRYASADNVQAMIAAGRSGPLASLGPYHAVLDYRAGPDVLPIAQGQAELIYIVAGRGTLNLGGASLQLDKGAAVYVPANAAHQFTKVDGLATISMRMPAGAAPTEGKTFASAENFRTLIAGGKNTALVTLPAPYRDTLQIRKEPQPALLHQKDDEYVYIAEGSGVFTVGGTMNDPKPTTPGNFSAGSITGGTPYHVAPGAVIFVPANTPHQFSGISGELISIDLHLPRGD
jgi:mannose-6-phosphate isomerase-like protein (cupin superfamily)